MKRLASFQLQQWKKKSRRKPLLLRGARQVGKTWLVREFGKSYSSFVEINLEEQPELISLFNQYKGIPKKIIEHLNLVLGSKIVHGETLLFIDEIQESSDALMSLRYFYEKLPQLDVVAAGSLLEFTLKEISFPVGRIEFLYLFPLNFQEYLLAMGEEQIIKYLHQTSAVEPIPEITHDKLITEIKNYCFLGGMPEVVKTYIDTGDFQQCFKTQGDLINNFRFDFNKYANRSKVPYMRMVFDSIPMQFAKKWIYSNISSEVKSRELSEALHLLNAAGLSYFCHHTSGNGVPLSAEINLKKFKVYFVDIGLALRILGFTPKDLSITSLSDLVNQGGIMEQFVAQEILSYTEKGSMPMIFYWQREAKSSSAEVDFLMNVGTEVIPIEVKSGKQRFSKSLLLFTQEKKAKLAYYISSDKGKWIINQQNNKIRNLSFYEILKLFETSP